MNLLDLAILCVFVCFVIAGWYKGFLPTVLSIAAFLMSWLLGMMFIGPAARAVENSESLYDMMLYYTEGSEYIDDADTAKLDVATLSSGDIADIIEDAELPYPMGREIQKNISSEAFIAEGINQIGDYFNQTIVRVFINILCFLAIFAMVRVILAFLINGVDYALVLPVLRTGDSLIGAGAGLIRGILGLFLIFMLLPIVLTVLGQFQPIKDIVEGSYFAPFFYRSNFLLSLMTGS